MIRRSEWKHASKVKIKITLANRCGITLANRCGIGFEPVVVTLVIGCGGKTMEYNDKIEDRTNIAFLLWLTPVCEGFLKILPNSTSFSWKRERLKLYLVDNFSL